MSPVIKPVSKKAVKRAIRQPEKNANKYTRGVCVAVGGSSQFPGAICMASLAAYRMGAGYVKVKCAPETLPIVHTLNPDAVATSWEDFDVFSEGLGDYDASHPKSCLVGSGLDGEDRTVDDMVFSILRECAYPVVVDGGAITLLSTDEGRRLSRLRWQNGYPTVVTPHLGEAARMAKSIAVSVPTAKKATEEAMAKAALELAKEYCAVIVLKGPNTYIAAPQVPDKAKHPKVHCMDQGSAALAKAGTGDVLAGMIAALLAQGERPVEASCAGAMLHAQAARVASREMGAISVMASDLPYYIPDVILSNS